MNAEEKKLLKTCILAAGAIIAIKGIAALGRKEKGCNACQGSCKGCKE